MIVRRLWTEGRDSNRTVPRVWCLVAAHDSGNGQLLIVAEGPPLGEQQPKLGAATSAGELPLLWQTGTGGRQGSVLVATFDAPPDGPVQLTVKVTDERTGAQMMQVSAWPMVETG